MIPDLDIRSFPRPLRVVLMTACLVSTAAMYPDSGFAGRTSPDAGNAADTAIRAASLSAIPGGFPDSLSVVSLPEIDSQLVVAGNLVDTTRTDPEEPDSLPQLPARRDTLVEVQHALRIGIDLAAPLMPLISGKDDDSGWMVMADYRFRPKLYAAAQFGHAKRNLNFSSMRTESDGWFAMAGVHYALLQGAFLQKKNKKESLDILYAGAKLGYSKYHRRIYDASIKGSYWGLEYPVELTDKPSAMWLDLSIGISVCLWNELYLSMSGGYDIMLSNSDKNGIGPLVVPGIGQVYNKSTAFSFSYGLSYRFPLYKRFHRVRIREKKETTQERQAREHAEKQKNFTPAFAPTELLEY